MKDGNVLHVMPVSALYLSAAAKLDAVAWQSSYQNGGGYICRLAQSDVCAGNVEVVACSEVLNSL